MDGMRRGVGFRSTGRKWKRSGGRGQVVAWDLGSHACCTSSDAGERPGGGEGACLRRNGRGEVGGGVCRRRAPNIPADRGMCRAITREAKFRTVATISFVGKGNEEACVGGKYIYIRGKYHYLWWGDGPCRLPAGVGGHPNVGMTRWPSLATQFSTRLLGAINECSENAYNLLVSPGITM